MTNYFKDPHGNLHAATVAVNGADGPSVGAFGRWRTAEPVTIFDSKQLTDAQPLFWDDVETAGSGTSSSHSTNLAATTMGVTANTAGTRVRQTFRSFNYFPGKSQLVLFTFAGFATNTGITKRIGQFNANNGLFLQSSGGVVSVVRRTSTSGSPVDNAVAQSSWNIDTMDGQGRSGITLDFDKAQILIIDYQWLGVGRVRFGFDVDGVIHYVHEMVHANALSTVYTSTPCLPLRVEIDNDGNGGADTFAHMCSSVISEGGVEPTGSVRSAVTTAISSLMTGTTYALLGLRLKSTHLHETIDFVNLSVLSSTVNDKAIVELYFNPTVGGTFTYNDIANSSLQSAIGAASNTLTGGTLVGSGFVDTSSGLTIAVQNARKLGAAIDGTPDEFVIGLTPITNNITVYAAASWRELL